MNESQPQHPVLDCHVHLAGIGYGDTGCFLHPRRRQSVPFTVMRLGLRISKADMGQLDAVLRERLLHYLADAPQVRIALLAMDWTRDERGEILRDLTDLYVPNDYVLGLAQAHEQIVAGVSIHPLRPDALEELQRCAEAGAALVKWLPISQNFSPADSRCQPFFEAMAALGMPLVSHTGSEGATRNIDKSWNNPQLLEPALKAGVTVIAAHAGMRSLPHDRDYFREWQAMLKDYPHFYADTASVFGLRARRLARALQRENVPERLLHGSDWPVPASPWWFVGSIPLRTIRELSRIDNPLLRDLETKRALGMPEEAFTRGFDLLRTSKA